MLKPPLNPPCLSCGWICATTFDTNSTVWNLTIQSRPFQLISPFLDCSSPETTPIQAEGSHVASVVLTRSGDVYVWWPHSDIHPGQYEEAIEKMDKDVPCYTLDFHMDPIKAPTLPDLPDLPATGLSEGERKKETKLIKIAALNFHLIGLTNKGHVLRLDGLEDKDSMLTWHYVSESANNQTCSQLGYTATNVL